MANSSPISVKIIVRRLVVLIFLKLPCTVKDAKRLLDNPGIIRNRLKIAATIRRMLRSFWKFKKSSVLLINISGNSLAINQFKINFKSLKAIPPTTKESDAMSKDLLKRGFKFVGSTICYAFMEAVGMTNDHTTDCFRYNVVKSKN